MSPNVLVVPALRGWAKRHRLLAAVLASTALTATLFCSPAAAQESPSAEQPQNPLDQKITLEIKVSSLGDLCKVLTQLSGVEFEARGSAGDRKATVLARDRRLGEAAEGIAEVSHLYFGCVKEGEKEGRYVFYEDDQHKAEREAKIEAAQRAKAEKLAEDTRWMLDTYFAALDLPADSPEWDRIKRESPWIWLALCSNEFGEREAAEFMRGLAREALDGLVGGTPYTVRFGDLSPAAQELLQDGFDMEEQGPACGLSERELPDARSRCTPGEKASRSTSETLRRGERWARLPCTPANSTLTPGLTS
jgi:hypothetical protein